MTEIIDIIQELFGNTKSDENINLHEPYFKDTSAWEYVKECIDSGWVSTAGKWVNKFETQLCEISNARKAIAVTNGTVALRLAMHVIGVKSNDEVLMPSMSFVATANAATGYRVQFHILSI